jgi:hypothetical protein
VVVELLLLLLLLLWSSKESNVVHGNFTCCTVDEVMAARRNIGKCSLSLSLSLSLSPRNPSASQVILNAIPFWSVRSFENTLELFVKSSSSVSPPISSAFAPPIPSSSSGIRKVRKFYKI